jgi:hypothetical protein
MASTTLAANGNVKVCTFRLFRMGKPFTRAYREMIARQKLARRTDWRRVVFIAVSTKTQFG